MFEMPQRCLAIDKYQFLSDLITLLTWTNEINNVDVKP